MAEKLDQTGKRNLITDVAGIKVGNIEQADLKSGVSALICEHPCVGAVQVLGGAPGTRETDALEPHNSVEEIHGLVLSGGSAFGLDAASGVQAWLREQKMGYHIAGFHVPIVPSAIIFDLANGGNKQWEHFPPYRDMGYKAAQMADYDFALGSVGAGCGALTAGLKGGLGSASYQLQNGATIGALVVVNSLGRVTIGKGPHFWAAPFELKDEFGGLGLPAQWPSDTHEVVLKQRDVPPQSNTTIAIIATDAKLTKPQAKRLAISAHDGFARAIWPSHTHHDGDLVFGLATGIYEKALSDSDMLDLNAAAGAVMARAIGRAIYHASPAAGDVYPCWQDSWGKTPKLR